MPQSNAFVYTNNEHVQTEIKSEYHLQLLIKWNA